MILFCVARRLFLSPQNCNDNVIKHGTRKKMQESRDEPLTVIRNRNKRSLLWKPLVVLKRDWWQLKPEHDKISKPGSVWGNVLCKSGLRFHIQARRTSFRPWKKKDRLVSEICKDLSLGEKKLLSACLLGKLQLPSILQPRSTTQKALLKDNNGVFEQVETLPWQEQ